jgi:hypothetical protein
MSASAPSGRGAHHFKLVLLGNSGVGKSSLVLRFVKNEFIDDMETTIGAAFLTKTLALEDCSVKLEVRGPAPHQCGGQGKVPAPPQSPLHQPTYPHTHAPHAKPTLCPML